MVERPPPTNGQAEGCGFESHDGRCLLHIREKRPILPDVFLVAPTNMFLIKFLASLQLLRSALTNLTPLHNDR